MIKFNQQRLHVTLLQLNVKYHKSSKSHVIKYVYYMQFY